LSAKDSYALSLPWRRSSNVVASGLVSPRLAASRKPGSGVVSPSKYFRGSRNKLNGVDDAAGSSPGGMKREARDAKSAQPLDYLVGRQGEPVTTAAGAHFGSVRFPGSNRRPARWVRFSEDNRPDNIMMLLTKTYGLNPPRAVISVTGDVAMEKAELSPLHVDQVTEGIAAAARKMGAWLFTEGSRDGVASIVGHAMHDAARERGGGGGGGAKEAGVPCIGVLPWGAVAERELLEGKQNGQVHYYGGRANSMADLDGGGGGGASASASSSAASAAASAAAAAASASAAAASASAAAAAAPAPASAAPAAADATVSPSGRMSSADGGLASPRTAEAALNTTGANVRLEPFHSHFLMVDAAADDGGNGNGPNGGGGGAAACWRLRQRLETFIGGADLSGDGIKTPIVVLAAHGDLSTLTSVLAAPRDDQSRRLGGAIAGLHGLISLHLKA